MARPKATPDQGAPVIILATPQLGENIGKAARVMHNFGLGELRLAAPRDGWPNTKAVSAAAGADVVLGHARVFETLRDALADLHTVYATSSRPRDMVKLVTTPKCAMEEIRDKITRGLRCGVVFGGERSGLSNEEVVQVHRIIRIPVNPAFTSLNLAQAVGLISYEWHRSTVDQPPTTLDVKGSRTANGAELSQLFEHLEEELDNSGFLFPPEKRPTMVRNIRNFFMRAELTEQEVRTLRGIVTALSHGRPSRTR